MRYLGVLVGHSSLRDSGDIELVDYVPAGLDLVSMAGDGWTCGTDPVPACRRTGPLAPGATTPPVIVTVDVQATALPEVLNVAEVAPNFVVDRTMVVAGTEVPDGGLPDGGAADASRSDAGVLRGDDGGCGCRVHGRTHDGAPFVALTCLAALVLALRRRRSMAQRS